MILLNSSAAKGLCYIETKNLDGETNLKHKLGVKEVVDYLKGDLTAPRMSIRSDTELMNKMDKDVLVNMNGGYVECENPNEMLYRFEGSMGLGGKKKDIVVSLNNEQMLLRGSSLRNTEFIYGIVVFTGHETKIMKNSVGSRAKFSKLERALNIYIFLIVMIQLTVSVIAAIFNTVW